MHNAIIFDVDGTLIDGTKGILKSLSKTAKTFNLPEVSDEILQNFIGPPIQISCKTYFNMQDDEAQDFTNKFREYLIQGDIFIAEVYNGIFELLKYLKEKQYKLGVATYKREDLTLKLLEHFKLSHYFDVICGADNDNKLTKTDILKISIDKLMADPDEIIMVGDSKHDAEAANVLGVKFIGVTYGFDFKSKDDIKPYNPIFISNNPQEILEYVKSKLL